MRNLQIISINYDTNLYITQQWENDFNELLIIELKKVPTNINEIETIINFVEWDIISKKNVGEIKVLKTYSNEFNFDTLKYKILQEI